MPEPSAVRIVSQRAKAEVSAQAAAGGGRAAPPPGGALGNNAGFVSPPPAAKPRNPDTALHVRYSLREANRDLAASKNQQKCGATRTTPEPEIWRKGDCLYYKGVVRCGSRWTCAVCAAKLGSQSAELLREAMQAAKARGWYVYLWTVTLRHTCAQAAREQFGALTAGLQAVRAGAPWKRKTAHYHITGSTRSTEATHGKRNGWHVHAHHALFTSEPLTKEDRNELASWMFERFAARMQRLGFPAPLEFDAHGKRICIRIDGDGDPEQFASDYIAKMGLALEVAGMGLKTAKRGNRTPMKILDDWRRGRDPADRQLWREWSAASSGRHAIHWSPGLLETLLPEVAAERAKKNQTQEEEDAEQVQADPADGELVCVVPSDSWDVVKHKPGVPARVLIKAKHHGADGALRYLEQQVARFGGAISDREDALQREQHQIERMLAMRVDEQRTRLRMMNSLSQFASRDTGHPLPPRTAIKYHRQDRERRPGPKVEAFLRALVWEDLPGTSTDARAACVRSPRVFDVTSGRAAAQPGDYVVQAGACTWLESGEEFSLRVRGLRNHVPPSERPEHFAAAAPAAAPARPREDRPHDLSGLLAGLDPVAPLLLPLDPPPGEPSAHAP